MWMDFIIPPGNAPKRQYPPTGSIYLSSAISGLSTQAAATAGAENKTAAARTQSG
jgi:hypothetical protein